jgi:hypothetical protein
MKKIVVAMLLVGFSAKAIDTFPVLVNPNWESDGVKVQIIEHLLGKYFEQPYRYNYDNPDATIARIDQYYFAMEGKRLPETVKTDIKNTLINHQNGIGKQNGFENSRGLATVLPKKNSIAVTTAAN